MCGYTIFYPTENNLLPSMEQPTSSEAQVRSGVSQRSVLMQLIHIPDIIRDTRIVLGIKDEDTVQMLQNC